MLRADIIKRKRDEKCLVFFLSVQIPDFRKARCLFIVSKSQALERQPLVLFIFETIFIRYIHKIVIKLSLLFCCPLLLCWMNIGISMNAIFYGTEENLGNVFWVVRGKQLYKLCVEELMMMNIISLTISTYYDILFMQRLAQG